MKKKLLLASFLTVSLGISAQFNWLQNGDLETAEKTLERTSVITDLKGDWAVYAQNGADAFTGALKTEADEAHKKVIEIAGASGVSWYKAYLMQNVKYAMKAEKYQLVFDARCVEPATGKIHAWIYLGPTQKNFALKTDFDDLGGTFTGSGSRSEFNATGTWQTFTADYDLAWSCNNYNSATTTGWAKAPTTEEFLANACVAFGTNAKKLTFQIDNVRLIPVNPTTVPDGVDPDPEPEPDPDPVVPEDPEFPAYVEVTEEGDFLKDTGFDLDDEVIQNWRTLDKGKFLGDTGHWYFYNEDKDGVDPYASVAKIQDSGDTHGKVLALINKAPISSWWGHNLLQRIGVQLQPMTYRLSFYARSASAAKCKLNIVLKEKDAVKAKGYALLDGFSPVDKPKHSGTTPDFSAQTEWQLVEYVFDLSKMAETIWSAGDSPETYIKDVANEELLKNAYLCIWNETANSTLEIDDVLLEPVDNYTAIQNFSFETNTLLPLLLAADPAPGARSGQWVVVNKPDKDPGVMNLSIDAETASEGQRSMKLETVKAAAYPRMSQYMAMDLYEVPEGEYSFDFSAKASQTDAPIRVDVYVYEDATTFKAVTGESGDIYEVVSNTDKGLTVFKATTEWTKYEQAVKVKENMLVRLIIRPNIASTGSAAHPGEYTLPVTHWFDNFSFNKVEGPNSVKPDTTGDIQIYALDGSVQVVGLENAKVAIYSINGSLVDQIEGVDGKMTRALAQGSYIVRVVSATAVQTVKILVK